MSSATPLKRSSGHFKDHFPAWIEVVVLLAILLVVALIVVEDLAIIGHWNHEMMFWIVAATFGFDLLFSIEFLSRSWISFRRGELRRYFLFERGWVDCLASLPLLLLVSGPLFTLYLLNEHLESGLFLHILIVLKTAKIIRVTRILRLIRVVRLFGRIQHTDSQMANRHIATISTISVVALILLFAAATLMPGIKLGDHRLYEKQRVAEVSELIEGLYLPGEITPEALVRLLGSGQNGVDVVYLRDGAGRIVYQNPRQNELMWSSMREAAVGGGYSVRISYQPADAELAKFNLFLLAAIVVLIMSYMTVYTTIFARTISDPIYVMDKGLRQWDYNYEVRVPPHHRNDEVFRLALIFNQRWLSLKDRIMHHKRAKSGDRVSLSVDEIL